MLFVIPLAEVAGDLPLPRLSTRVRRLLNIKTAG
jgi:hypothetical protein